VDTSRDAIEAVTGLRLCNRPLLALTDMTMAFGDVRFWGKADIRKPGGKQRPRVTRCCHLLLKDSALHNRDLGTLLRRAGLMLRWLELKPKYGRPRGRAYADAI